MANLAIQTYRELNTVTEDLEVGTNDILFSRLAATPSDPPEVSLFDSSGNLLGFNYTASATKIVVTNPTESTVTNAQIRIL